MVSKSVYADGNNYYVDKFAVRNGIEYHIGMINTGYDIKSLKKAKCIANGYLHGG